MLKRRRSSVSPPPDGCALMVCVQFLRRAWAPNILWYLRSKPRRFSELRLDLGRVSPKVLTQRLKQLENDGLVQRERMATSPPSVEYRLTALGEELQPTLDALVAVGEKIKLRSPPVDSARE